MKTTLLALTMLLAGSGCGLAQSQATPALGGAPYAESFGPRRSNLVEAPIPSLAQALRRSSLQTR